MIYTSSQVRRHIFRLNDDKPFSIRDFLNYGSRAAVDQTFYRLVNLGIIIRVARGLYIKATSKLPDVGEIAQAKAAAFHKYIVQHGQNAAYTLKLIDSHRSNKYIFACIGHSSSFRFGNDVIQLVGISPRKAYFADSKLGLAIRALWHMGKYNCSPQAVQQALSPFNRTERQILHTSIRFMPQWLRLRIPLLSYK